MRSVILAASAAALLIGITGASAQDRNDGQFTYCEYHNQPGNFYRIPLGERCPADDRELLFGNGLSSESGSTGGGNGPGNTGGNNSGGNSGNQVIATGGNGGGGGNGGSGGNNTSNVKQRGPVNVNVAPQVSSGGNGGSGGDGGAASISDTTQALTN